MGLKTSCSTLASGTMAINPVPHPHTHTPKHTQAEAERATRETAAAHERHETVQHERDAARQHRFSPRLRQNFQSQFILISTLVVAYSLAQRDSKHSSNHQLKVKTQTWREPTLALRHAGVCVCM